jgi:hypothetical protein
MGHEHRAAPKRRPVNATVKNLNFLGKALPKKRFGLHSVPMVRTFWLNVKKLTISFLHVWLGKAAA